MRDVLLREAAEEDVPMIVALIHAAFAEYQGKLEPPSGAHNETEAKVRQKMFSARVVLAVSAGQPIGCVFYEQAKDHLSLSRLAIPPEYRRRGIGRALIAYVEERARALKLGHVRLGVRIALPQLRTYYERLGYQLIEYCAHEGYATPTYVILEKTVQSTYCTAGK